MAKTTEGLVWVAGVGARAGLGASVARRFAREGLIAVLTGRSRDRLEGVAAQIRELGGKAVVAAGDVSDEAALATIARTLPEHGVLRAAIFNAASAAWAPSLELTAEAFESTWRTSTLGGFLFAREALRLLLPEKRGSLLFTGATASLRGKPPFAAFAAAKAGLRSLAQTFAREFGPQGIHVAHVVVDGGIDGERLRSRTPDRAEQAGENGLLNPDAIADVYWHLHTQAPSTFTQELDLRPFKEPF